MKGYFEYSWNLEKRIKEIECSDELKTEILKYMEKRKSKCANPMTNVQSLFYRQALHYIEDNINKPELINELRKFNNE